MSLKILPTNIRNTSIFIVVIFALIIGVRNATTQKQRQYPEERVERGQMLHLDLKNYVPDEGKNELPAARLPWSRLVYQSIGDVGWDIFIANDDGSDTLRLTHGDWPDIHPDLRRGGDKIAFASKREDDYEIYVMNIDGAGQIPLTTNEFDDVRPVWSPDGDRILFESYRDGQPEIYVMNSDGGGQTRLTYFGGYDGMPSWSPDGSKIAFVSQRNGQFYIYSMNADGSGVIQLSDQPYSFRPAWSPDGKSIAFDSDNDGDGWQELWVMDADGSNPRYLSYSYQHNNSDMWVRGWSPDGKYITFTQVYFVMYGGNWYWSMAKMQAQNLKSNGDLIRLTESEIAWSPHWQSLDVKAPVGQLKSLVNPSPAPVDLHWVGADIGGSGVAFYDVQVKISDQSEWSHWQTKESPQIFYPGVGGTSYQFRVRARDAAFNAQPWSSANEVSTIVEALPPESRVNPLPEFHRFVSTGSDDSLWVSWAGSDPGMSGIMNYNIQTKRNDGVWQDWQEETLQTTATFHGATGFTYEFRSQAKDMANNVEEWPASPDASTTFYRWGVEGVAQDNTGTPVSGTLPQTTAGDLGWVVSDENGLYSVYTERLGQYDATISWSNSKYGDPHDTKFLYEEISPADWKQDVFLPPANNSVKDWGFESQDLNVEWLVGGSEPPVLAYDTLHTGEVSLLLGSEEAFNAQDSLTQTISDYDVAAGSDGVLHVVYSIFGADDKTGIMYRNRIGNADWSEPISIVDGLDGDGAVQLKMDAGNRLHLMWRVRLTHVNYSIYYANQDIGGNWIVQEVGGGLSSSDIVQMAVENTGIVHFVWDCDPDLCYTRRDLNGNYSVEVVEDAIIFDSVEIGIDSQNNLHILWAGKYQSIPYDHEQIYYVKRRSDGVWTEPRNVSKSEVESEDIQMALSPQGSLHLTWIDDAHELYYAEIHEDGSIGSKRIIRKGDVNHWSPTLHKIAADGQGGVHIVWHEHRNWLDHMTLHVYRDQQGAWSSIEQSDFEHLASFDLLVDSQDRLHMLFINYLDSPYDNFVSYQTKKMNEVWSPAYHIGEGVFKYEESLLPQLAYGEDGAVHSFWLDDEYQHYMDGGTFYAGLNYSDRLLSSGVQDSVISQVVSVPVSMANPTLSFLYQHWGLSDAPGNRFVVQVDDGDGETAVFETDDANGEWTHQWIDMSPWLGQTVTIKFSVLQEADEPYSWTYLDEVTIGSSYPDIWVLYSDEIGLPNEIVSFDIGYGNRGGALAENVQIMVVLPPELAFVEAFPAPTAVSPTLVWDIGDLSAKSNPFSITVTSRLSPSSILFDVISTTASIDLSNSELEKLNNLAEGTLLVSSKIYLPVVRSQN